MNKTSVVIGFPFTYLRSSNPTGKKEYQYLLLL